MHSQNPTNLIDDIEPTAQPMQSELDKNQLSEFSQQLQTVTDFILIRQATKNSLSKIKNQKTKNTIEQEKITQADCLKYLFTQLSENLSEGHTICPLDLSNCVSLENITNWQTQQWLTVLDTQTKTDPTAVNTPLVMQYTDFAKNTATFWLQREWAAEYQLAQQLLAIAQQPVRSRHEEVGQSVQINVTKNNAPKPNAQQQQAITNAQKYALSIITGGPGTGKTFTVAQLVQARLVAHAQARQDNPNLPPLAIALTAPTGKAAQRMRESLAKSMPDAIHTLDDAKTLHRLLGIGQTGVPRYHAANPLSYDVVIVDEASMLGLELASQLVDAIRPTAQLILLGDANQLAAVEAGAVLSDLCQVNALQPYHTELTESKRFAADSALGQLAQVVLLPNDSTANKQAKFQQAKILLTKTDIKTAIKHEYSQTTAKQQPALRWFGVRQNTLSDDLYRVIAAPFYDFFALMRDWQTSGINIHDAATRKQLFAQFDAYRVLSAGHRGRLGTQMLNKMLRQAYFNVAHMSATRDFFYHGVPIMINKNDYQLGLFNGDIGICVQQGNTVWVCFADQAIDSRHLSQESCEWAYALSIHKSQGSEFDHVAVCIDASHQRLLSQELVYTAITRSRGALTLVSSEAMLRQAITQRGNRQTGLMLQFDAL